MEYHKKSITLSSLENLQGLLNCVGENVGYGALAVVCLAATNILVDFLLLIGSCCRVRLVSYNGDNAFYNKFTLFREREKDLLMHDRNGVKN